MHWLGVDIGGANLKLADGNGYAESHSFAIWKDPDALTQQLRTCIAQAPPNDHLVVTMTGELADCFETKAQGVSFILDTVERAADGRHTRVYLHNGTMVTPQVAKRRPHEVAAANWHALARFATRFAEGESALLIDVGSTTTDIIHLDEGQPAVTAFADTDRLISGELVYSGVSRTAVCAVVTRVPYRGQDCRISSELFATMRDAYLILGELTEDGADENTADGRPATKASARTRLGRMICADPENFNHRDAVTMAHAIAEQQAIQIGQGLEQVSAGLGQMPGRVILSGQGEFAARRALTTLGVSPRIISLSKELSVAISRCAPAHALAVLSREAAGA